MTKQNKKPTGWIIWRGKSPYDGKSPIACIAVESRNKKTGKSLQTFIIRTDIDPLEASRMGTDDAICGDCNLRGLPTYSESGTAKQRPCYVTLIHAPYTIFKQMQKNAYPEISGHDAIAELGSRYQLVRCGAYGDPSMIPPYIHESLVSRTKHTAYSHQTSEKTYFNADLYMRSADTLKQAKKAWNIGERTFRIVKNLSEIVKGKEIACPASDTVTCLDCKLCGGASVKAKSIAIVAHGAGAKYA